MLESAAFNAAYNKDKVGSRFRILSDITRAVIPPAASVTQALVPVHGKVKLGFVTYYQSNAGTISDLLKNNIFVIFLSSSAIGQYNINFQLCYKDL